MISKDPTINLIDWRKFANGHEYSYSQQFKIESMKNTIDYVAGEFLTDLVVKDLINKDWNVNIRASKNSDF